MSNIKLQLSKQTEEDEEFFESIRSFLNDSGQHIGKMKEETENDLEMLRQKVAKFFCEDPITFKLEECLRIFVIFEQRFKVAMEDNKKRFEHQQKAKTRQMNHSAVSSNKAVTKEGSQVNKNSCQVNGQLAAPNEFLKAMSRSLESSNGTNSTLERTASLNRRRSRPNSQDVSDLHSNLVEFLTNPSNLETPNIDGNLFGSNFRRVGSGRRSSRNLNGNSTTSSTIPEDSRERMTVEEPAQSSTGEPAEVESSKFNRFSPLRRTMNYKSTSRDTETNSDKLKQSVENSSLTKDANDGETFSKNALIPTIKVSSETSEPKNSQERTVTEDFSKVCIETPKQLPVISNLRKNTSQYIQQLTAIISPTKFIESNDALHQHFEGSNGNSGSGTDCNIIVSTVANTRPNTLPSALPPIAMRRTPSFVLGSDGKATTPVNAAIVMPMQKMAHLESNTGITTDPESQLVNRTANDNFEADNQNVERKGGPSQLKTCTIPAGDASSVGKGSARKSSIPVPSKSSTVSTGRAKGALSTSLSFRQQSAVDKRIAWAMSNRNNGQSLQANTARRPPASNGRYYRTPSTVSRTGLNSDMGSMLSLQRSSLMGTLSSTKSLDSSGISSSIPQSSAKASFMKPTSSSSAKTRM